MEPIRVGLVADPASPTQVARRMTDLVPPSGADADVWDVELVSEPFTLGSEDVDIALARLRVHADRNNWDLVIGVTELPLRNDDGRYLLAAIDPMRQAAVLSLPALGGFRVQSRARHAVRGLVDGMAEPSAPEERRLPLPGISARGRVLMGMVIANRPWLLAAGLKSALVAALATGAVATIEPTVWLLAYTLSGWRLAAVTVVSIAVVIAWIVIDGRLWDHPDDDSPQARERSRLYNTSTLLTLTIGVMICYVALYLVNLAWALFVLDPETMSDSVGAPLGYGGLFVLAWFVASAATLGGALGTGLESDDAIRAAAYSKREEERRARLAAEPV
ncbi:hypothetical protein ACFSBZ_12510 [Amnibacterium flavum]|uniref:5,10-methylene-tetrahydrofolate dehydrogenase n=1 Tax=Amnibacterium flavum TaxID=2173173 RepID=A0A2V1HWQ5_9MICO|nr:hypothetical protein [Amnibacterium flavum]PVZ95610.1 hypothetical protein DDQ50_03720 [Amnibacterium flavum]